MRWFAVLAAGLALLSSAFASDRLSKAEIAVLLKGDPVVRVTRDEQSKSLTSGRAFAAIDIPAPPAAVFAALTDCARAKRYVKSLASCRALKRDPAGLWEVRETLVRVSVALPEFRAVARLDLIPSKQIRFKQTEGSFDYAEGQWDLAPFAENQKTRVFYHVRAGTSIPVPEFVLQNVIESDLPETLKGLRREVLSAALAPRR